MITIDDLKTAGIAEDKATQIITDLGDIAKKFTPENVGKKAFDEVDLSILTHTKVQKENNEKTTDYLKRALGTYAESFSTEKTSSLNQKISDLEDKLKNHKGDETLKSEIEALKKERDKLPELKNQWVKEWKDKAEQAVTEIEKMKKVNILKSMLPDKIKNDYSKDYIDFKINSALEKAMKDYDKFEVSSDGNVYLVDSVKFDKVSAKEFFAEQLKDIVDTGAQATGGGASGGNGSGGNGELMLSKDMNDGQKITEIRTYLATQKGITVTDTNYEKEFNKILKDNGLEKYITNKQPGTAQ